MISYCEVHIGDGASAGCSQCATPTAGSPRQLAEVIRDMESVRGNPASRDCGIALMGFEPFAHPALPQLIGEARTMGFDRIRISTDGRSLDQGGNAFGAFSAGVTHLELMLLAGDPTTHDRLAGRSGLFESASRGARDFAAAAGSKAIISGSVPLCKHNVEHAASAVAYLAELGAVAVELDATRLRPSAPHSALVRAALETATLNRLAGWVSAWDEIPEPYSRAPWRTVGSRS